MKARAYLNKRASDPAPLDRVQPAGHRPLLGALYGEDFDAAPREPPKPEALPEPVIVEPVFTAADLVTARAEGRADGRTESDRSLAATRVRMLDLIGRGLAGAQGEASGIAAEAAEAVARTMLSALTAALPALCAQHGVAELQAVVRAVLPGLAGETRVTIRINPLMVEAMRLELDALDSEFAGRVAVIGADELPLGDIRLSWQDGSAVRDTARVCAAVNDALAALGLLETDPGSARPAQKDPGHARPAQKETTDD